MQDVVWDIPYVIIGYPGHVKYMGYPMGCPNIPMAYLVKPVDHVMAVSRMDILWDIPRAIVGYPIPLYLTSHGTSTGISYITPQPQDSLRSCTFSRLPAPLRRRCSSSSGHHKPLSSHFFRLLDCTFQWKRSTILPQPYVHLKQLASRPAVSPGICGCLIQKISPQAIWNGWMCVARHAAWYESLAPVLARSLLDRQSVGSCLSDSSYSIGTSFSLCIT